MPSNYLPTPYQEFIHLSRYSRWLPDKNRRETWDETVSRYFDFFTDHLKEMHDFKFSASMRKELEEAVLDLRVMPSMRCLMTAGEALNEPRRRSMNDGPCWRPTTQLPSSWQFSSSSRIRLSIATQMNGNSRNVDIRRASEKTASHI